MANVKEIVTKAVIGKTKKSSEDKREILLESDISNVLGCWIINHNFSGVKKDKAVVVSGSYDVNVWYSYDNNTKTNVIVKNFSYDEIINVKMKKEDVLTDKSEIMVRSLTAPVVSNVSLNDNKINLTIEKELAVEIVGDMKVRVNVEEMIDDYEEEANENDGSEIKMDINENYLKGVNQN